jgi:ABC-type iron transport system FetAB ATPase subunit
LLSGRLLKGRTVQDEAVLRIDYLSLPGLPPLSFEVPARECLAVEGPSGAGKTRLLRAIADLDPSSGYVFLEGVEKSEVSAPEWRRRVRYAAAEPVWWSATAREHVPATGKLDRLLSALALDETLLDRPLIELSSGERQRLGLIRAIADEPQVLLLDEPTSALDPQTTALAEELIKFQMLAGRTLVLVSRDAAQVARLAHAHLQLSAPAPDGPAPPSLQTMA